MAVCCHGKIWRRAEGDGNMSSWDIVAKRQLMGNDSAQSSWKEIGFNGHLESVSCIIYTSKWGGICHLWGMPGRSSAKTLHSAHLDQKHRVLCKNKIYKNIQYHIVTNCYCYCTELKTTWRQYGVCSRKMAYYHLDTA